MKNISLLVSFAAFAALAAPVQQASAQVSASLGTHASTAPPSLLSAEQAAERFRDGERLERKRNLRGAFDAYLEAGESGHGLAQKKLGDIYSNGNTAVERNYETALRWYHKAREQGIEIPKPFTYPGLPVVSLPR